MYIYIYNNQAFKTEFMWLQSLLENMLFSIKSLLLWWWSTIGQATSTWLHSALLQAKLHLTLEAKVTNGHLSLFLPNFKLYVIHLKIGLAFQPQKLWLFKILHLTDFELDTWRFLSLKSFRTVRGQTTWVLKPVAFSILLGQNNHFSMNCC